MKPIFDTGPLDYMYRYVCYCQVPASAIIIIFLPSVPYAYAKLLVFFLEGEERGREMTCTTSSPKPRRKASVLSLLQCCFYD